MTATAAQIAKMRRMTNLVGSTDYSDAEIQAYIEAHPLLDERGELPYSWVLARPPTQLVNPLWIATYDLAAAAAALWSEKAAVLAADFDFQADGGDYTRSQAYEQAMKQARYWAARRSAKTVPAFQSPNPNTTTGQWVANLPEGD